MKNRKKEEEMDKDVVVLRLNEDGSFDPYTPMTDDETTMTTTTMTSTTTTTTTKTSPPDYLKNILGRGGLWEYRDNILMLAPERPKTADPSKQVNDTLFVGRLEVQVSPTLSWDSNSDALNDDNDDVKIPNTETESSTTKKPEEVDVHLSMPKGTIDIGKFMYPKKHKAFFDEPMLFKRSNIGSFQMSQILGNLNARLRKELEAVPKPAPLFQKSDFHNRTFYLTTAPHPVNPTFAKLDVHYDETKATLDVRVMSITFYPNNTFAATGVEKILRGRYDIIGDEGETLYFRVSLFGFGRSLSGSVYSEGRLLSQDDRRAYRGRIQSFESKNQTRMFVEGEFYYGFGPEAFVRSNSMGTFTLQEIEKTDSSMDDDDDDDNDDDGDEDDDDDEDENITWGEDGDGGPNTWDETSGSFE